MNDTDLLLLAGLIAGNVDAGMFRCELVMRDGLPHVIVINVVSERRFDVTITPIVEET